MPGKRAGGERLLEDALDALDALVRALAESGNTGLFWSGAVTDLESDIR